MKNHILLKINALICGIIIIGFLTTAVLSYKANFTTSVKNIEQVSALTSEGIYYQLTSILSKPLNVSLTMANDSLLKDYLAEEENNLENEDYAHRIQDYLSAYKEKYSYDSVFLVSTVSNRYYHFDGIDRYITRDNPENDWYFHMLETDQDYLLNVDNDEVEGADNGITVFVNCKIHDGEGKVLGIVGVGVRIEDLQELLQEYEENFGIKAFLIDENGLIEISTEYTGYEKVDIFKVYQLEKIKDEVLGFKESGVARNFWTMDEREKEKRDFIVSRYIPELSWHLLVERNTAPLLELFYRQLIHTAIIIAVIIGTILVLITYVIRGFSSQIVKITKEHEERFRKSTEQLYDNIYELDITRQRAAGKSTEQYFESLGATKDTSYDEVLQIISEKQIAQEHRDGFVNTFCSRNVIREYEAGNTHLQYDFLISENGSDYLWMRIDAYSYYNLEDKSIRMFTYWKNIDVEKRRNMKIEKKAQIDEMTGLFTKMETRRRIEAMFSENKEGLYGFFIFDIDNFKQANDLYGHAFGDAVIIDFANSIKANFRKEDVIGRIGGDEFVAFIRVSSVEWAEQKAEETSRALNKIFTEGGQQWRISVSIGVAIAPKAGTDFETIYRKADYALYETKRRGKNGYTIFKNLRES